MQKTAVMRLFLSPAASLAHTHPSTSYVLATPQRYSLHSPRRFSPWFSKLQHDESDLSKSRLIIRSLPQAVEVLNRCAVEQTLRLAPPTASQRGAQTALATGQITCCCCCLLNAVSDYLLRKLPSVRALESLTWAHLGESGHPAQLRCRSESPLLSAVHSLASGEM